jgi:hypothetical protein
MNNLRPQPIAKADRRTRSLKGNRRWVSIWLGMGVLFALILLANSFRDYFFVARILSIQEVRHQMAEHITVFERQLSENVSSDEPLLKLLTAQMSTGPNKPLWIVLREPEGHITGQTGIQEREAFTHDQEITHFRNRQPLFDVIPSRQGAAVVEVFPVFIRPERIRSEQSATTGFQGPFVIAAEVALPLTAADPAALWPIRRNLVVSGAVGFALLLTVGLTALGFRSYIRGQHLERQMEIAHQVQADLLPRNAQIAGVRLAAEYQPADEVAGDFYDTFRTERGVALLIGDVSGKGLPAAPIGGSDPWCSAVEQMVGLANAAGAGNRGIKSTPLRAGFRRTVRHVLLELHGCGDRRASLCECRSLPAHARRFAQWQGSNRTTRGGRPRLRGPLQRCVHAGLRGDPTR